MTPYELIEVFRKQRMVGSAENLEDLANSVEMLAKNIYSTKAHFIFELIQNAEDNEYESRKPRLRFDIRHTEIDGKSGPALIVHNNETGFQDQHVKSICRVGKSTKTKAQGYIGEKGIGFKSVFNYTSCPYIFSNGFHFCLPERNDDTVLKFVVPRWVSDVPDVAEESETTIILPIDKSPKHVAEVVANLRDITPETILFLKKLESLEISVDLPGSQHDIAIEKHVQAITANSKLVDLTYLQRKPENEETCETIRYWLTEIEFSKPEDVWHEKREDIESRMTSVAIPLSPNAQSDKLFAYLPVWESTGLPFLINADFLLTSNRQDILHDEAWNHWLRDCIVETYVSSLLELLSCPTIPFETRIAAYGSIPLETHVEFLRPIIQPIQENLTNQQCVFILSDHSLVAPQKARLCPNNLRAILGAPDDWPRYLRDAAFLVCPDIEKYEDQVDAIGVKSFSPSELEICLQKGAWVQNHAIAWFVDLYRFLKSQKKFDVAALRSLLIVPIEPGQEQNRRLSCDAEQPIYFAYTNADRDALVTVPDWLSQFAPIAFLKPDFLTLLNKQNDKDDLKRWMTTTLNVYDFSIENYCVDILAKILKEYPKVDNDRIVAITQFLVTNAGRDFNWESLPIILSDGRKVPLQNARKLTFTVCRNRWRSYEEEIQAIVTPISFDTETGWQHIWQTVEDRQHFLSLSDDYDRPIVRGLLDRNLVRLYPFPRKHITRHTDRTITNATEDYHGIQGMIANGSAMVNWLNANANEATRWPNGVYATEFEGEHPDLEWACQKEYHLKDGRPYKVRTGRYQFKSDRSTFLKWLCDNAWLPTTKGPLRPSQAFLPKQGIREVFGDSVPYFEGELSEKVVRMLGIRSEVATEQLIDLLRDISGESDADPKLVIRIYEELNVRLRSSAPDVKTHFASEPLILIHRAQDRIRWCKSGECVWEDASSVLSDSFVYLSNQYPKLQDFFIERLGVKRRVDTESYAQRWLGLQETPASDMQRQREIVEQLYRKIKPVAVGDKLLRPRWWDEFSKNVKLYTQTGAFQQPANIVLPDDGELQEVFQESDIEFAWRPTDDAYSHWEAFFRAFGTPLLSEAVTEDREDKFKYEILVQRQFLTESSVKMIAAWLRERRKNDFDQLLNKGVFAQLASLREAVTSSEINVRFQLKVNSIDQSKTKPYPIFWDHNNNLLIYSANPEPNLIAKTIARGLIRDHAYKDLAHWIELTLGASDTRRLKGDAWSVPQEIITLFASSAATTSVPTPPAVELLDSSKLTPMATYSLPESLLDQAIPPREPAPSDRGGTGNVSDGNALQAPPKNGDAAKPLSISPAGNSNKTFRPLPHVVTPLQGKHGTTEQPIAHSPIDDVAGETAEGDAASAGDQEDGSPRQRQDTTDELDYLEELRNTFNRGGETEFSEEPNGDDADSGRVKNPQRRREKLAEDYRDRIENEPSPEARRRDVERSLLEGPNKQVRAALDEWYHGKCQICGETWPKRDGEPYFTAAYLVERKHARWLDEPGNAICLCAKHFAQWRLAAVETPLDIVEQIQSLRLRNEGGNGDLSIYFTMLDADHTISYDERHFLALRTLIEVVSGGHEI